MALRTPTGTILNTNDCVFPSLKIMNEAAKRVGPVRILLTQFSYANWAGNPGDEVLPKQMALAKLNELRKQAETFRPEIIVPFASFVWFCHKENFHHNEHINTVHKAYNYITKELGFESVVLYPGDCWDLNSPWDSTTSLKRYEQDYLRVQQTPVHELLSSAPVTLESLTSATAQFFQRMARTNSRIFLLRQRPTHIFLTDLGKAVSISPLRGLKAVSLTRDQCDIEASSESILYLLQHDWGGSTLHINGRFIKSRLGHYKRFKRYIDLASFTNAGQSFPSFLTRVKNRIFRKFI